MVCHRLCFVGVGQFLTKYIGIGIDFVFVIKAKKRISSGAVEKAKIIAQKTFK